MARARERARAQLGIHSGVIVTVVRERGPEEAEERVREAVRCRSCGVVGVDLAGDEENYPPGLFSRPLALAREAGLGITAHAGEFAGPSSIWTAIYQLGATRIGHGIRAVEDPALLDHLRDRGITLELCPTSNLRLGLVPSAAAHPMRALVDHGVAVTINSDDPMLLDTDISRELALAVQVLGGGDGALQRLLAAAARAAFLPDGERRALACMVGAAAAR
jgi:adenosine deaminase